MPKWAKDERPKKRTKEEKNAQAKERQQRLRDRRADLGLIPVQAWIAETARDRLIESARKREIPITHLYTQILIDASKDPRYM